MGVFQVKTPAIANGNGGFDHHHSIRVDTQHQVDHILNMMRIEVIPYRVIIGRGSDDYEIGILVRRGSIQGGRKVQLLFRQIFLYVFVLYRRLLAVKHLYLFWYDIHRHYQVTLCQQGGNTQSHVTGSGHGDLDFFRHIIVLISCF